MTTFNWTDVDSFTCDEMCAHAKRRAPVLLESGRVALLVRWPGDRLEQRGTRRKARVEFRPGAAATIEKGRIVAVDLDPTVDRRSWGAAVNQGAALRPSTEAP